MILALANGKDGRLVLIVGIDARNVDRLTARHPLVVDGTQHGLDLPVDVVVYALVLSGSF